MRKFFGIAALALVLSTNVSAAGFSGVPTGWKLESYGANGVVLWYTPSTCGNGQLLLPAGSTVTDHNRLYATVLAAKSANISMFIIYEIKDNYCFITSFGLE
jgi:hypothetical protein